VLHLNLWKKQLGSVPEDVWDHADLESLVLADNGLSAVSERIGLLKRLRMLDLGHNALTSLPSTIGDLESLTDFLYLHDNELQELPVSIAKLTRLRYLNISDNPLGALPPSIGAMTSLVELRASKCNLTTLPSGLDRLVELRELHLRDNALTTLPDAVGALQELRHLDLRGNPLTTLPEAIGNLPKLDKLDLRWTPTLEVGPWLARLESRGALVYR
jgi:Leucine-rich repeat (LRR) protein